MPGRDKGKVNRRTFGKLTGLAGLRLLTGRNVFANKLQGSPQPTSTQADAQRKDRRLWSGYLFGAAYYPEWWRPAEWETDFRQMQDLGINTVRMGEFAWATFEPAPGKFDFSWMDEAIAIANRHNVNAILGTPTAAIPPWLYQLHPDVLTGNASGLHTYGGRKGYNTNSRNYLDACARIVTALADHYGRHPGVIGWQLDNEPGFPFELFDPVSERAFQVWLRKRYGTLEALNRRWNGAFWSNQYTQWTQIHFPTNSAEGGWQPAITLDYRRFFSDSFLHHLRAQADILRARIQDQFLYTNWPSTTWSVDVYEAAEFLDATAWDNYVSAPGLSEFQRQYIAGINHDIARCAGPHQRFLCAEQIAYVPANALQEGLRLQAYINLAHGSYGHLYFEWRRPLAGNEQYRPSFIKRFDGEINPEKPVFEQIHREFDRLGVRLAGATTRADIALLYDFSNEWAQGFALANSPGEHFEGQVMHYYCGFKTLQRNIDLVPPAHDLSGYKLVVAAGLRLVDDATAERLHAFVASGGTLVLNYRAGTQNMDAGMRRLVPPGVFADMAGVTAESNLDLIEYGRGALNDKQRSELGITFSGNATVFPPQTMIELLSLRGAAAIATYRGGRMEGQAAITRCRHGEGWVYYVAADSADNRFYETLAQVVGKGAGLLPLIAAPYGVEVVSRENEESVFYFLLNLTEEAHGDIPLPQAMEDMIRGDHGVTRIALGPLEVAALAAPK